jgi:phospholipid-translocating ATPase
MELMKISIQRKIYDLKADEHNIKKCLADESQTSFCSFFDLLLLCSTVFPTEHEGKTVLNSVSPDDMALATAAQFFGLSLIEKNEKFIKICKDGKEETWKVLAEIPFSSERKKMTVIVENEKGESFLFTKGADMVILPMIKTLDDLTNGTLLNFAREGLRTLVMAGKKISKKKLDLWLQEYQQIMIGNSPSKDEDLDTLSIKIEKKLELFGVSAIEDKLQEGVPEAISLLTKANIRIWMITGDKEETAEEIAKSCNLLSKTSELIQLYNSDFESIKSKLKELHSKYINKTCNYSELEEIREAVNLSISMNGIALSFILQSEEIKKEFFQLAYIAKTCICCRMSPAQKSEIVKLCRSQGTWTTLSVGDGANDVAMIQEAHVGIGVAGKEGTQAMLAAEYTISQFSHLTRMLLVHGRYSYIRMSKFINYNFYKNFISCFCEGWLAFYCGYSGQLYFLDWVPPFYSFFWTSWPCLAFFSLEQDVSPSQSMIYPNLYTAGQKNAYFSIKIFLGWNFLAFLSATFIFWLSASSLDGGIGPDGHEPTLFWMTNTSMMILVHTVNLKLIICSKFYNKINL